MKYSLGIDFGTLSARALLVEVEAGLDLTRGDQVPVVDRIECPTQDADAPCVGARPSAHPPLVHPVQRHVADDDGVIGMDTCRTQCLVDAHGAEDALETAHGVVVDRPLPGPLLAPDVPRHGPLRPVDELRAAILEADLYPHLGLVHGLPALREPVGVPVAR